MNKQIFCNRKGGAMIKGIFYPLPRTSAILSAELRRKADKIAARLRK